MSSTILKLIDMTEELVRDLNLAIDGKLLEKTRLYYEKLQLLNEVFKAMFSEDDYKDIFSRFDSHLGYVGHFLGKEDFDWMKSNAIDLSNRDVPNIKQDIYKHIETVPVRHGTYCFKTGTLCSKEIEVNKSKVFIGMPFRKKLADIYTHGIVPSLQEFDLEPWRADQEPSNIDIMCKVCEHLQESKYVIINITDWNPNVLFELGLAYGLGKIVVIIKDKESGIPVDLKGMEYIEYETSEDLRRNLEKFFSKLVE